MKKLFSEFKEFISKGNVLDLAVGIIIGSAFTNIVNSIVKDLFMPLISLITGRVDFTEWQLTLVEAQGKNAPVVLQFGNFVSALLNFFIVALVIFFVVKAFNKMRSFSLLHKDETSALPTEKECPFCKSMVNIAATRCPHCTSQLQTAEADNN